MITMSKLMPHKGEQYPHPFPSSRSPPAPAMMRLALLSWDNLHPSWQREGRRGVEGERGGEEGGGGRGGEGERRH